MRLWMAQGGPLAAVTAAALAGCGGNAAAPGAATLPLAPQMRVIASAAGGSEVDPGHDRNRYRYLALTAASNVTGAQLVVAEVQSLVAHRWGQERSVGFRGTATAPQPVPVTTPGAEVLLNAPDGSEYAAMSVLTNPTVERLQTAGTPLAGSAAIGAALAGRRPVLWVVLGHGSHPRAA